MSRLKEIEQSECEDRDAEKQYEEMDEDAGSEQNADAKKTRMMKLLKANITTMKILTRPEKDVGKAEDVDDYEEDKVKSKKSKVMSKQAQEKEEVLKEEKPEEQYGQEEEFEHHQEFEGEKGNSIDPQPDKEPEHQSETNDNDDEIEKKEYFRETGDGEEGSVRPLYAHTGPTLDLLSRFDNLLPVSPAAPKHETVLVDTSVRLFDDSIFFNADYSSRIPAFQQSRISQAFAVQSSFFEAMPSLISILIRTRSKPTTHRLAGICGQQTEQSTPNSQFVPPSLSCISSLIPSVHLTSYLSSSSPTSDNLFAPLPPHPLSQKGTKEEAAGILSLNLLHDNLIATCPYISNILRRMRQLFVLGFDSYPVFVFKPNNSTSDKDQESTVITEEVGRVEPKAFMITFKELLQIPHLTSILCALWTLSNRSCKHSSPLTGPPRVWTGILWTRNKELKRRQKATSRGDGPEHHFSG
ncbi:hypothetical protein BLNAU_13561 [Blattamonas nauphoetae]|uniref:Uncharacterized protein n=1 Tax=Blattamonas nauphoetae TaxID=2049346 RepID=A0ABQ9XJ92_9EUKA|nr:hypothetical protein BLNAU_13561 [Blattamonas nauphoetae]